MDLSLEGVKLELLVYNKQLLLLLFIFLGIRSQVEWKPCPFSDYAFLPFFCTSKR